ncbi:AMP-binding protein [Actinoallomurus iriomotensis]|uniref:Acyl-CoA synthetase n=1 Tax=Actinoallomurus iriomotensis TaxID=478107 RepID=A0A9W6S5A7_9ACTN|nr:AMP-binding protein [Actinoallomurus iriomotensis]GLY88901.1 acyl-CoA synthetase [Actinoallomurus iriomotensis]
MSPGSSVAGPEPFGDRNAAVILDLVRGLAAETRPFDPCPTVTLDSVLERELGLSSLELAELLVRAEEVFGVVLPAETLATVQTPRDLLRDVSAAPHEPAQRPRPPPVPGTRPARLALPEKASTLVDALRWHGEMVPDRTHVRVLDETGTADELTYGALNREAARAAAGLIEHGLAAGDKVAIMLPTGRSYFVTYMGVLMAGAIPVPVYPPARLSQLAEHLQRQYRILTNARATSMVTVPEAVPLGQRLRTRVVTLRDVLVPGDLDGSDGGLPTADGDDIALLQYTSGSTGHPKGVVLTHRELLANIRAMGRAEAASPTDTFVSWLPLYHDMGLIGAWLSSMYFGVPLVVMPPQMFLSRPSRWLRAIGDQRGTISAGPNFAYELCLRKIDDAELQDLDLRCWRLAFNGAEPVRADTIERFAARFAAYGLRPEAITPVYGLAEACVGLTFPPLGRGPMIDRVVRERFLRSGRAVRAADDDRSAVRFVACGRPLPGYQVRVVGETGGELADRREGRIEFRGPSATGGYHRDPAGTQALRHGDWLDTGDLGYLADGELYVTGRVKDIIIRAGRNLHPEEIEAVVGGIEGVRAGCVAVFAAPDPGTGTERLVVLAEIRQADEAARAALRTRITGAVVDLLGAPPDDVVLTAPHIVPKTSSGKVSRTAARAMYRRGTLRRRHLPAWLRVPSLACGSIGYHVHRMCREGTAVAFAAYDWLLAIAMFPVVLAALAVMPGQRRRRRAVRAGIRLLARLTGTPVTVVGVDRLPAGAWVAVANHASWLDGAALTAVLPESCCFVAGEIYARRRLSGFVLRCLGTEFVERVDRESGVRDTARLTAALRRGQRLVMFPEGRLAAAPRLRAFHMGAFVSAARAGVPVVPVTIQGTRSILCPGQCFPRHGAVRVTVESPIRPEGTGWAAAVQARQAAQTAIAHRSGIRWP